MRWGVLHRTCSATIEVIARLPPRGRVAAFGKPLFASTRVRCVWAVAGVGSVVSTGAVCDLRSGGIWALQARGHSSAGAAHRRRPEGRPSTALGVDGRGPSDGSGCRVEIFGRGRLGVIVYSQPAALQRSLPARPPGGASSSFGKPLLRTHVRFVPRWRLSRRGLRSRAVGARPLSRRAGRGSLKGPWCCRHAAARLRAWTH